MPAQQGFSITMLVVDKISDPLGAISSRMDALTKRIEKARAPIDKFQQSFEKFGRVTGLTSIATGFTSVARAGTETFRSLLRVVEPLAAITGAASLAGLYRLTAAWGQFGTQLGQQAVRAGLSAEVLQNLQGAARLAGVPVEALTTGMTKLNDNMRDAAFGGAPQFIAALQALGLSYEEVRKKSPVDVLKVLADRLKAIKSPTDRAAFADALGLGPELLPLLAKGSKGIAELSDEAARLTGTLGEKGVQRADAFRQSQERLILAVQGFGNSISESLAPAIGPVLDQMAEWIVANRDWIAQDIATDIKMFSDYLKSVDWTGFGQGLVAVGKALVHAGEEFAHAIEWLDKMGLAGTALGAVLVLKVLGPLSSILRVLGLIGAFNPATFLGLAGLLSEKNRLDVFTKATGGDASGVASALSGEYIPPSNGEPDNSWLTGLIDRWFGLRPSRAAGTGQSTSLAPGVARTNGLAMADVFASHGYSREGIAALLGSGMAESGLNPTAGAGSAHQGLFQWDSERSARIAAHFGKRVDQMTARESAEAAAWELDTDPRFAAVRAGVRSHDLVAANDVVTRQFEAPGNYDTEIPNRLAMSEGALKDLPSGDPITPPLAAAPSGKPGANGRVDMNVTVQGSAQVTASSSGDVGLKIEQRNVARDGY